MDGLEAVEVRLSEAIGKTKEKRWDSEYFLKGALTLENILKNKQTQSVISLSDKIKKGIFDLSPNNYLSEGIPFIRTSEIKNPILNFSNTVFISEDTHKSNIKTQLKPFDLVFTKIGAYIGDVALLPPTYKKYNFSQNVVGVSIKNILDSPFLLAFFLSKYGKAQVIRSAMLSGQGKLELNDIRNYIVPVVTEDFKNTIKKAIDKIFVHSKTANNLYSTAESLLLLHLGLGNYTPNPSGIAIKNLGESFGASGRLDSEYYLPKYEEIVQTIEKIPTGYVLVKDVFSLNNTAYKNSADFHNYIEIGDVDTASGTATYNAVSKDDLPANAKIHLQKKDILYSTVRPYRGAVAICNFDEEVVVSGAFTVLQKKSHFLTECLFVLLRSQVYKDYIMRFNVGSSYPVVKDDDVLNLKIPNIAPNTQTQIAEKVQESFALRKEAHALLEKAKKAVELAIEQDEATAMDMLCAIAPCTGAKA